MNLGGNDLREKILWAYGYFICISIVLLVFIGICFKTNDYHWMTQDRAYVLNGWQSSITGDEIITSDTYLAHAPMNQEIYYWRQIPEEPLGDNRLIFYSVHQEVKVYIEDRLIYSHRKGENVFGKSPGNLWNIVSIPRNSAGKRLTISLSSPYRQSAGAFQKIYYGDKYTIIQEIKETYSTTLLIGYCILGVGIGIIFIWSLKEKIEHYSI